MSEKTGVKVFERRGFMKKIAGGAVTAALTSRVTARPRQSVLPGPISEKRVKIGVVGGRFGLSFYWHKHPNSTVTAVCDLREDRLRAMQETFGTANAFRDFRT